MPVNLSLVGNKFTVPINGVLHATPLLVALAIVELTDLVFAMDSIPAVLAITRDPFIVITSNVFAILGLRALYFLIGGMMERFHYLKPGLIVLLLFIGTKMMISEIFPIPTDNLIANSIHHLSSSNCGFSIEKTKDYQT